MKKLAISTMTLALITAAPASAQLLGGSGGLGRLSSSGELGGVCNFCKRLKLGGSGGPPPSRLMVGWLTAGWLTVGWLGGPS